MRFSWKNVRLRHGASVLLNMWLLNSWSNSNFLTRTLDRRCFSLQPFILCTNLHHSPSRLNLCPRHTSQPPAIIHMALFLFCSPTLSFSVTFSLCPLSHCTPLPWLFFDRCWPMTGQRCCMHFYVYLDTRVLLLGCFPTTPHIIKASR